MIGADLQEVISKSFAQVGDAARDLGYIDGLKRALEIAKAHLDSHESGSTVALQICQEIIQARHAQSKS
jgi:hypothetical protein